MDLAYINFSDYELQEHYEEPDATATILEALGSDFNDREMIFFSSCNITVLII